MICPPCCLVIAMSSSYWSWYMSPAFWPWVCPLTNMSQVCPPAILLSWICLHCNLLMICPPAALSLLCLPAAWSWICPPILPYHSYVLSCVPWHRYNVPWYLVMNVSPWYLCIVCNVHGNVSLLLGHGCVPWLLLPVHAYATFSWTCPPLPVHRWIWSPATWSRWIWSPATCS